jgi:hypothetical protein
LLTKVAPDLKRAAMIFNPDTAPYIKSYVLPFFEAAARSLKIALIAAPVRGDAEIETAITALGREAGGGLLGMPDNFVEIHRALIISLAARSNVPAVYQTPVIARDGGLLSYGANFRDIFRRSTSYVDRILRGAKPSELPFQLPIKYQLVVNLRTAKALGLTVPPSIVISADERAHAKPPLDSDVADTSPIDSMLTPYDHEHLITYLRVLDADAQSADWRDVARIVLHLDPEHESDRARKAFESHLSRAKWMTEHGYRHLLRGGASA